MAGARRDRWPSLGLLALVAAAGGIVSGIFLAFHYAPTLAAAHASVERLRSEVALGGFLRGLHHWSADFALVLAALHGARLFWHGAYKHPRRDLWMLGCGISLVLLGFAYTGYLLPGDERAYTAMHVMQGVAESIPVAGEAAARVVAGGSRVSSATLTHVYAVHTQVLPIALVALVVAFALRWRRRGPAPRHDEGPRTFDWPRMVARDSVAAAALLAALGLSAALLPPALGAAPDLSGSGSPETRPEWFLLWVNKLLSETRGATFLLGAVLPGTIVVLAFALPFLARGRARAPGRRVPEIAAASALVLGIAGLTAWSLLDAPEPAGAEETEIDEPAPGEGDGDADALALRVDRIMSRRGFDCRGCHVIDGDPDGGDEGPKLDRRDVRRYFTKAFFRQKVADPEAYWEFTNMRYRGNRKPTDEQVQDLVRWFYESELE